MEDKWKAIFNLFIECETWEIIRAEQICKQKQFSDFERRLSEICYLDQF